MTLPGWTREPLVQFLVAGALLYAFFAWIGGNAVDPSSRVIDVDREQQAMLALQFERTMGRAPTDAELDAQIERFVRDEVLYREALRLGLDQNDAVVRRRMVSKMDMTAGAAAEAAEPDEEELRAFFRDNAERYAGEISISFEQRYFRDREAAAAALKNGAPGEATSLPPGMKRASVREIAERFGTGFAAALRDLEPGPAWQGPFRSGFGWHIVRITDKSREPASFEAMRARVENDWRSAQIEERKERAYRILRDGYRIEIDR